MTETKDRTGKQPTNMRKRPSLVINAMSTWAPLLTNTIISLILTPLLVAKLGKENYGIWILVASFIGYYGLLRMGVGSGMLRYIPYHHARDDSQAVSQIMSSALGFFLLVGLIIAGVSFALSSPLGHFYSAGEELVYLIRLMGLAAAFECIFRVFDSAIRSYERWLIANMVVIAFALIRAAAIAVCLYMGYGLVEIGYATLISTTGALVLAYVLFKKVCGDIQLSWHLVQFDKLRGLAKFGLFTMVIKIVYTLRLTNHKLIIGKMISLEAVAIYAIAAIIIRNARLASESPISVLFPRFAYLDGKNRKNATVDLLMRSIRYGSIITAGIMLIVFAASDTFIYMWLDQSFAPAVPVVMVLGAGTLIEGSFSATGPYLSGLGFQKLHAIITGIEGIIEIAMAVLITLFTDLGLLGIALSFLTAVALMRGIVMPIVIGRMQKVNPLRYYTHGVLLPWLITGAILLTCRNFNLTEPIHTWSWLIVYIFGLGLAYTIPVFLLATTRKEKIRTLHIFRASFAITTDWAKKRIAPLTT